MRSSDSRFHWKPLAFQARCSCPATPGPISPPTTRQHGGSLEVFARISSSTQRMSISRFVTLARPVSLKPVWGSREGTPRLVFSDVGQLDSETRRVERRQAGVDVPADYARGKEFFAVAGASNAPERKCPVEIQTLSRCGARPTISSPSSLPGRNPPRQRRSDRGRGREQPVR